MINFSIFCEIIYKHKKQTSKVLTTKNRVKVRHGIGINCSARLKTPYLVELMYLKAICTVLAIENVTYNWENRGGGGAYSGTYERSYLHCTAVIVQFVQFYYKAKRKTDVYTFT